VNSGKEPSSQGGPNNRRPKAKKQTGTLPAGTTVQLLRSPQPAVEHLADGVVDLRGGGATVGDDIH
jgi:hypothetical protein